MTVFAGFGGFENVWCQNRVVESIELLEPYTWKINKRVGRHLWANRDGYSQSLMYVFKAFVDSFRGVFKELRMSGAKTQYWNRYRTPRVVPANSEIRELARHFLDEWRRFLQTFDVSFKGFVESFCEIVGEFENVWCQNRVVESIELVELYFEST